MSDPQKYRTKDEVEEYKEKDSIAKLASHLMTPKDDGGRGCLTEGDWKSLQKELKDLSKAALDYAEQAEMPGIEQELRSDVYAAPMPNLSPTDTYHHGVKNPLL